MQGISYLLITSENYPAPYNKETPYFTSNSIHLYSILYDIYKCLFHTQTKNQNLPSFNKESPGCVHDIYTISSEELPERGKSKYVSGYGSFFKL